MAISDASGNAAAGSITASIQAPQKTFTETDDFCVALLSTS